MPSREAVICRLNCIFQNWHRVFILALSAMAGLAAAPPHSSSTRHLAIVIEGHNIRLQPQVTGLRNGLEELKYIEGENFTWTQIEGSADEMRLKLKSLMERHHIDVVVTLGTAETAAAKQAVPKTPIVFLPVADPVKSGFVRSLASPGSTLTGLAFFTGHESVAKQLEVFKHAVPPMRKVWAVFDERFRSGGGNEVWTRLRAVAAWLRLELIEHAVTSSADAARKIAGIAQPADHSGVFVVCSGLFKDVEALAAAAAKRKQPLFGCNAFQVAEQNAVLSYGPDLYSLGYRGAWFVDRLFRGAKPQELPVEMPRKFELVINTRAAAEVGVKIPREVLMLADRVFK